MTQGLGGFLLLGAGWIWFWIDSDSGSQIQDLISPVGVSWENVPVLSVCQDSLSGFTTACLLGVYGL